MDAINAADAVRAPEVALGGSAEQAFLLAQGFTAVEAARLPEGMSEKRLLFARWLVAHGRLHEGGPAAPSSASGGPPGRRSG